MTMPTTRRKFLTVAAAGAGVALTSCGGAQAGGNSRGPVMPTAHAPIPSRVLGKTGAQVSILGLGGWHLGAVPAENEAIAIVHEAIEAGVNFFDDAWEY